MFTLFIIPIVRSTLDLLRVRSDTDPVLFLKTSPPFTQRRTMCTRTNNILVKVKLKKIITFGVNPLV